MLFACCYVVTACRSEEWYDLAKWQRAETLWKASSGHTVARFERETALSKNPEVIVCEDPRPRRILVLAPDTFVLVAGNTLNVFSLEDRMTPGWYRITRTHGLTWWERHVYTNKSLGGWEWIKDQSSLPLPSGPLSRGSVLALEHGQIRKVADEGAVKDLFEIPVEGPVYVGEPGIGVVRSIDLLTACP